MKKVHFINNSDVKELLEQWLTIQEILNNNLIIK